LGKWVLAALVPAALVAVPSAIPQTVVGRTLLRTVELGPGSTKAFALTCPSGYPAVSAGVYRPAPTDVRALSIRARGPHSFVFRFRNASSDAGRRIVIAASCRRAGQGRSRLRLSSLTRSATVRIGPSSRKTVRLACPSGTVPAAAGFDLGRAAALSLGSQTQTLHTVTFRFVNRGAAARSASFYSGCLTLVRPPGSSAELKVTLTTEAVAVEPGTQTVTRRCHSGWLALGVGYSLRPSLELRAAAAGLREGRWSVSSTAGGKLPATLQLVCGRLS
jgi:hypothetical protein